VYIGFWVGKPEEGDHLQDGDIGGMIILKWIFKKLNWGHRLDRPGSGWKQVAGCCECGNKPGGVS
jgi:hypothetical protein